MKVAAKDKNRKKIEISPDFRVSVNDGRNGAVHMMIHADGHDGDTLDFTVVGNKVIPWFTNVDASGMNLAEARDCLLRGDRVGREGLGGVYIEAQMPDENSKMTDPYIFIKTEDGSTIPWVCSQADFFAGNFVIILENDDKPAGTQGTDGSDPK